MTPHKKLYESPDSPIPPHTQTGDINETGLTLALLFPLGPLLGAPIVLLLIDTARSIDEVGAAAVQVPGAQGHLGVESPPDLGGPVGGEVGVLWVGVWSGGQAGSGEVRVGGSVVRLLREEGELLMMIGEKRRAELPLRTSHTSPGRSAPHTTTRGRIHAEEGRMSECV